MSAAEVLSDVDDMAVAFAGDAVTVGSAALAYARSGLRVVPLHNVVLTASGAAVCSCSEGTNCGRKAGKHPRLAKWNQVASSDVDAVSQWLHEWPTMNVGLAMGGEARLVALDVDGSVGMTSLASLEATHGEVPNTLTARTGSGGLHLLFRVPSTLDASRLRNRTSINGSKLDVRWEGGQIAVAPSLHASGKHYEWINIVAPADLPEWLYVFMTSKAPIESAEAESVSQRVRDIGQRGTGLPAIERARRYVATMPSAIQGSAGSDATFDVARVIVQDFKLGDDEAMVLLREYSARCEPPWPEHQLLHKLASAKKARVSRDMGATEPLRAKHLKGVLTPPDSASEPPPDSSERCAPGPSEDEPCRGLEHLGKVALVGHGRILEKAREAVSYVWQDIAVSGTIVLMAGGPAEGKTTLLFLVLVARMHEGPAVELLSRKVTPAPKGKWVVLIEGEHGEVSASRKLVRSCELLNISDLALSRVILVARKAVRIGSVEWKDVCSLVRAGLVSDIALDTIARVAPADANDEAAQVAIFDLVAQAIEEAPNEADKPTVWIVAHTRKGGNGTDVSDVSGSTQRSGQADSVLMVNGEKVDGRVVSSTVTFAKLREDPDEYPVPATFVFVADASGVKRVTSQEDVPSDTALEDRILSLLTLGPKTKTTLANALCRSKTDIEAAISALFDARRIVSEKRKVNGRERTHFALREQTSKHNAVGAEKE